MNFEHDLDSYVSKYQSLEIQVSEHLCFGKLTFKKIVIIMYAKIIIIINNNLCKKDIMKNAIVCLTTFF